MDNVIKFNGKGQVDDSTTMKNTIKDPNSIAGTNEYTTILSGQLLYL